MAPWGPAGSTNRSFTLPCHPYTIRQSGASNARKTLLHQQGHRSIRTVLDPFSPPVIQSFSCDCRARVLIRLQLGRHIKVIGPNAD